MTGPVTLQAPITPLEAPLSTKEEMVAYATKEAQKAGIDPTRVIKTIECESSWNTSARGDGGHSRGLSQIHDMYHPKVTDEMADNPRFAIDFIIGEFAEGNQRMWTCARTLGYSK